MTSTLEQKVKQALALGQGSGSKASSPPKYQSKKSPSKVAKEQIVSNGNGTKMAAEAVKPAKELNNIPATTNAVASVESTKANSVNQNSTPSTPPSISRVSPKTGSNAKASPLKNINTKLEAPNGSASAVDASKPSKSTTPKSKPAAAAPMTTPEGMQRLYDQALERKKRMETLRNQSPSDCTFTPDLITSKSRLSRSPASGQPIRAPTFEALYQDSLKRQKKQKQKVEQAQEHPEGCTFSPAVNKHHPVKGGTAPAGAMGALRRSQALYEESQRRRAKQADLRKQREEAETPSFRPKISNRARRAPSPGPAARMQELYQTNKGRTERLEAQRQSLEMSGCTFKPKINRRGRSVPRGRRPSDDSAKDREKPAASGGAEVVVGPVQDRLAKYKADVDRKREEMRRMLKEQEDKELTFKPNVGRARGRTRTRNEGDSESKTPDQGQIHSRLYNEARHKQEVAAKLRSKLDEESGLTFQPNVNRRRSASARRARPMEQDGGEVNNSVFERLNNQSREFRAQHMKREEEKLLREMQECTFTPKVNHVQAKTGTSETASQESSTPIWERLYKEQADVLRLREEIKLQQELDGCTFSPTISHSASRTNKKANDSTSSSVPVYARLAEQGKRSAERVKMLESRKAQEDLSKCTFKPKLSKASSDMVRANVPVWRRLASQKELPEKTKVVAQELRERKLSECTFQPKVNPTSVLILENPDLLNSPPVAHRPKSYSKSTPTKSASVTKQPLNATSHDDERSSPLSKEDSVATEAVSEQQQDIQAPFSQNETSPSIAKDEQDTAANDLLTAASGIEQESVHPPVAPLSEGVASPEGDNRVWPPESPEDASEIKENRVSDQVMESLPAGETAK